MPTVAFRSPIPPTRRSRRRFPTPVRASAVSAGLLAAALLAPVAAPLAAQEASDDPYTAATFRGLALREIGPALTSGRISDFAVNEADPAEYFVAVSSGGVWKTENSGTTYEPVFDAQGSYSIGVVTLDPTNPNVVWVGTGENNAQRSVGYGDGVYRSENGGKSWEHVGLERSEHVGSIVVHPEDPDVVFVAAQGPLWSEDVDEDDHRGVYRTTDGGETWENVLRVGDWAGAAEVVMHPTDPEVLYASTWQRARRVWTYIGGGPESGFWRSTDGGDTWEEMTMGLPSVDIGRIGICVTGAEPDLVYAIADAQHDAGGFFRSTDRGASFERRSEYATSGLYYQEIMCDRFDPDRVVSMNTFAMVTNDGGATWSRFGERFKHVDNHALWQDPDDPDHYLNGNDGGIYESWDGARTWHFKTNLPVTQFYKVTVDNDTPFYNVYGGTQDNFSLGGPSRTTKQHGIVNEDWFVTHGGDGFESAVDPENPDIVYAQSQYGVLVRYDRASGEEVPIQPQPGEGEEALRWNWDAPLLVSPHSSTRLYFAANKVFRSDDRGDSWTAVSGDLTSGIDRNEIPVMGRVWSMDAVSKNSSTTIYGNIVALDESPLREGLLWAGTDDGLVHVTEDGGGTWRRIDPIPGVPERTYVNMLLTSRHDANTVFAAFNAHKQGDFRPYLYRSDDLGATWTDISGDLPERGSVYAVAQDPGDADLLFAGTEFGVFFSRDGGERWIELTSLPTIAVRDLAIQEREHDLVLGTFGRGFWVLDDYRPLREATPEVLAADAHLFGVRDALLYIPRMPLGLPDKAFQGEAYYTADNPPFGATFTYWLKDGLQTRAEARREAEREAREAGEPVRYPPFEAMRAEDEEQDPYLLFTVTDAGGEVVRRLRAPGVQGVNRVSWDLRYPSLTPIDLGPEGPPNPFGGDPVGPLVVPGTYAVSLSQVVDGQPTRLAGPVEFEVVPLNAATLAARDTDALLAFQREAGEIQRDVRAASEQIGEMATRLRHMREAVLQTPGLAGSALSDVRGLERRLADVRRELLGDFSVAARQFETLPSILQRVEGVVGGSYQATAAPTASQEEQLEIARTAFADVRVEIDALAAEVRALEDRLVEAGAPYTPGRWDGGRP